ncbi:MAG: prenyltransferase/squalene oxidase repeat-containing protein [Candidatus Omnitrophota bacterium]
MFRKGKAFAIIVIVFCSLPFLAGCVSIKSRTSITGGDIQSAVIKGVKYLNHNQNYNGSISLRNDNRFDVWETANVLYAMLSIGGGDKKVLARAKGFLKSAQNKNGSFNFKYGTSQSDYCLETTAVVIMAMTLTGEDVKKSMDFLSRKQNQDGSWKVGYIQRPWNTFPSVTGYALNALLDQEAFDRNSIENAVGYIYLQQKKDGSWGRTPLYYDSSFYPIFPILKALAAYGENESVVYKNAVQYIKHLQNTDGSFEEQSEQSPSLELRTALALNALLVSPDKSDLAAIYRGIVWLLKQQQPNGAWNGGYYAGKDNKKEDIFSTAMALLALHYYQKQSARGELE